MYADQWARSRILYFSRCCGSTQRDLVGEARSFGVGYGGGNRLIGSENSNEKHTRFPNIHIKVVNFCMGPGGDIRQSSPAHLAPRLYSLSRAPLSLHSHWTVTLVVGDVGAWRLPRFCPFFELPSGNGPKLLIDRQREGMKKLLPLPDLTGYLYANIVLPIRKKSSCKLQDLSPTILERGYPGGSNAQFE